jgi:hypothetical protein
MSEQKTEPKTITLGEAVEWVLDGIRRERVTSILNAMEREPSIGSLTIFNHTDGEREVVRNALKLTAERYHLSGQMKGLEWAEICVQDALENLGTVKDSPSQKKKLFTLNDILNAERRALVLIQGTLKKDIARHKEQNAKAAKEQA